MVIWYLAYWATLSLLVLEQFDRAGCSMVVDCWGHGDDTCSISCVGVWNGVIFGWSLLWLQLLFGDCRFWVCIASVGSSVCSGSVSVGDVADWSACGVSSAACSSAICNILRLMGMVDSWVLVELLSLLAIFKILLRCMKFIVTVYGVQETFSKLIVY